MRWTVWLLMLCLGCLSLVAEDAEMVRRFDFRKRLEKAPEETLSSGLSSGDPVIRNRCVYECYMRHGRKALPILMKLAGDANGQVAHTLLTCGIHAKDTYKDITLLKALADKSPDQKTRRTANRLTSFNFYRNTMRLKDDPTHDMVVTVIKAIPLPEAGWSFRPDPWGDAHKKGWFKADFDDVRWRKVKLVPWEKQGYPGYDGVAWYRLTFTMPPKPDCNAVELHFQGVDELAWVWLNGVYVGQHDEGPGGWNKPFWIDVTRDIRWNGENQLTVRVEDSSMAGGIWRPVSVEVLK